MTSHRNVSSIFYKNISIVNLDIPLDLQMENKSKSIPESQINVSYGY